MNTSYVSGGPNTLVDIPGMDSFRWARLLVRLTNVFLVNIVRRV